MAAAKPRFVIKTSLGCFPGQMLFVAQKSCQKSGICKCCSVNARSVWQIKFSGSVHVPKILSLFTNQNAPLAAVVSISAVKVSPPQPFYGPLLRTTWVSRCQKKTSSGLPEENFVCFMVLGRITRGRHTDNPGGCYSVQTNQQSTSINPSILHWMPFLPQPSQFILAWDGHRNMLDCISPSLGSAV